MLSPKINFDTKQLPEALLPLLTFARQRNIEKGKYLVEQGLHCNLFFLVLEGVFRTYRTTDEQDFITGFTFKGDLDTNPYSLFNNIPSTETIEALTDAVVLIFPKEDLFEARNNNLPLQDFIITLLANYVETLETRLHQNRSMTAEQRYLQLLQTQPEEIKKIPLGYIASYLGITKERLSRIRKKLS
ncbi:MAG: Crp/Fnr family transcriptional regulator [Chitinophagaceae bacterium]|nr:Crp/Fnr family transcriptional regulator [Chitinophagaceae bacterium]